MADVNAVIENRSPNPRQKQMPGAISRFKLLIIAGLEAAMNRYLALDEHAETLLTPLDGKVIALNITPFAETVYLCPSPRGIQVLESYEGRIDATLSGSLPALGLMGLSATPLRSLYKGDVRISGDTHAARQLQKLFAKLDIDLEQKLALYTNEKFASSLGNAFRGCLSWGRQSLETFGLNLGEFLQEETRELPAKAEAEIFFQQVDVCRCDLDRLQARIERLNNRLDDASKPQNH